MVVLMWLLYHMCDWVKTSMTIQTYNLKVIKALIEKDREELGIIELIKLQRLMRSER